jgi:exodeoxyribonuclease VII large subunit
MTDQIYSVSDFLAVFNQVLETAFGSVSIEGEVSSFKVNQNKYVFFDLKDQNGTLGCFMTVWQLRMPIEDGMKVIITAQPKLTAWGKFSLTVQQIRPSGEGSLKKSFELLKEKLDKEGLFAPERKRMLPQMPHKIAVITSTQAAGYADFIKILNTRWGGLDVQVAHTQVQGEVAADQMIRAIKFFNEQEDLADVLVLIRGGGSADDLASYNDEQLVREIAASRIPTLVGVGHEVDTSLADLAADLRAATPSNAAQLLVPDRQEIVTVTRDRVRTIASAAQRSIDALATSIHATLERALTLSYDKIDLLLERTHQEQTTLRAYDPHAVLRRGYALVRGTIKVGSTIEIETASQEIQAEVTHVKQA